MIRGTTAQFKFKLPYKCSELSIVKVTFWQPNNNGPSADRPLPIVKILSSFGSGDSQEVSVTLSEGETLRFMDKYKAYVQVRGMTIEGATFGSKPQMVTVYPLYDDEILGEDILPTPDGDGWVVLDGEVGR